MFRIHRAATLAALVLLAACQDRGDTPVAAGRPAAQAALREGYIRGRDRTPLRVLYEVRAGRAIWQGDIDLGPATSIPHTAAELTRQGGPRMGVTIDGVFGGVRWPGGVVPYVIDAALPSQSRVTSAISAIEAATNVVDFVPRSTQADYIRIAPLQANESGCSSAVGRQGGVQYVYLDPNCATGYVEHELLHALGMGHEIGRCDRDTYVRFDTANILATRLGNFEKLCDPYTDVGSYDEGSIMHYPANAFAIDQSKPTIISLRGLASQMGQRNGLSAADILTVDWMYPTPPAAAIVTSVTTTPSPAVQYQPYTITINGSGFDPATVQVQITGSSTSSCPTACTYMTFTSKTATQMVIYPFSLSIAGTYQVWVRNPVNAGWSGGQTITVRSFY